MQETSQKLDTIGAKQKDLRKQLHDPDKEEALPSVKRGRLELCLYISLVVSLHRILMQYSFVVTLS